MNLIVSQTLFLVALVGLSGCVNVPDEPLKTDVAQTNASNESLVVTSEEVVDPDLPNLELDAKTLELLLRQHFESYNGEWERSSDNALQAAKTTRDYRIARTATVLALRANNYAKALEGGQLWSELQPEDETALSIVNVSMLALGNVEQVVERFDRQRGDKSLDKHIRYVAEQAYNQRNSESAINIMRHYTQVYPDSAQVMLSSAQVAQVFEKYDQAEVWLDQAMQLQPGWELAAHMKAQILGLTGKNKEQADFVAQYAQAHPESVLMNINYATNLARLSQYQRAFDLMQAVLSKQPKDNVDSRVLRLNAAIAQQLGNTDLAKRYYNQALAQDQNDDDARWSLARIALIDEKYITAERLFNDVRAQESFVRAQIQVANARYHTKGLDSALDTLELLEPTTQADYIDVALARHRLLLRDYRYEEAFGYINEVLLYLPDNLEIIYARALVAAELRKLEISEADFRTIIAQQPQNADALNALGYTLADQTERYEEARVLIAKALEIRPDAVHILDSMGWVLYRLSDYPGAIEFLEKAYVDGKEVEIGAHLGEVYWESGEQEKAKEIWLESFQKDSASPVLVDTLSKYGVTFTSDEKSRSK